MKKILSFLACLALLAGASPLSAQVKLTLKPNTTKAIFSIKLSRANATTTIDLGNGEHLEVTQGAPESGTLELPLIQVNTTFATPSTEERVITIPGDELDLVRISNPSVIGLEVSEAPKLRSFACSFTSITKNKQVDFSQAPRITDIILLCDITSVIFPENTQVALFTIGNNNLSSKDGVTELDLTKLPRLEELSITNSKLTSIDLTQQPELKKLVVKNVDKHYLREIKGVKKLKSLTYVDLTKNALSYDQLPDLNSTDLDNFKIAQQGSYRVPAERIQGLTIDLSNLLYAKGLGNTNQKTEFTWKYNDKSNGKEVADALKTVVPKSCYTEKDGVFTFNEELFRGAETVEVRCYPKNQNYPEMNWSATAEYKTYAITLNKAQATGVDEVNQSQALVRRVEGGFQIEGLKGGSYKLYDLSGRLHGAYTVAGGTLELEGLQSGIYLLSNGRETIKLAY